MQVQLHESLNECNFDVLVTGNATAKVTATRRPVVVYTHGEAPFSARGHVVNKNVQFSAQSPAIEVRTQFMLDEIHPYRGGRLPLIARPIIRPLVRRGIANGDLVADQVLRTRLTQVLETELGNLVEALNKVPPLVEQAHMLLINESKVTEEKTQIHRAATKNHLLFSIGKPDCRIPELPRMDKEKRVPVELWIAVSDNALKEQRRKFMLQNWQLIVPLLRVQFESHSPELAEKLDESLAKLLDEVHVQEMPGWHILTFGPRVPLAKCWSPLTSK